MTNSSDLSTLPSQYTVTVSGDLIFERWYYKPMWNTEWVTVPVVETIQQVICATTNRVFVGAPLCTVSDPTIQSISSVNQSRRPKPRISESEFELCSQCCKIRADYRHGPKTSQAVRRHVLTRVCIIELELGSLHACYLTFHRKFDRKWNSSGPWSRTVLPEWRN